MDLRTVRIFGPLGLSALLAGLTASTAVLPQAFNGSPSNQAGSMNFDRTTPGVETITINSANAEILWTAAGGTFLPVGNTATFQWTAPGFFSVLTNNITATGAPIVFNGAMVSLAEDPRIEFETAPGDNIVVGSTASVDMWHILLRAPTVTIDAGATFSARTGVSIAGNLVLDGAIQIGNGGQVGTLGGDAVINGQLTFNRANNSTVTGNLSGGGVIVKRGAGVLQLLGGSTFSGETRVEAGTLQQGAPGAFASNAAYTVNGGLLDLANIGLTMSALSGAGGVVGVGSAMLTVDQASNTTFAGQITGTGSLTKQGTGTLRLSGTGSSTAGANALLANGGVLQFFGGSFTAAGLVSVDGGDLSVLAGARLEQDDPSRGVQVLGGNLLVDGANSLLTSNAQVTFSGSSAATGVVVSGGAVLETTDGIVIDASLFDVSLRVSGAGSRVQAPGGLAIEAFGPQASVTVDDGATLVANTVVVQPGTVLRLGSGGLAGRVQATWIGGSGSVVADFTDSVVLDAALVFNVGLTKNGSGLLTVTGNNTTTGATTVNGGTLAVNGAFSGSAFAVNAGGTLGGTGLVGTTIVNGGGTLAPGNSIGTIGVAGNLTFGAGSSYAVEVSPAASDLANVSGSANLSGGSVVATFGAGTFSNRRYTILNAAGGLAGTTFTGVTDNAPGVLTSLVYDANNAYLDTQLALLSMPGLNRNQAAVAGAIDTYLLANGSLPGAFVTLDANGLTLASGITPAGAMTAAFQSARQFMGLLADPTLGGSVPQGDPAVTGFAEADDAGTGKTSRAYNALLGTSAAHSADAIDLAFRSRWTMWGAAHGGTERTGGSAAVGSPTTSASTWGVAAGADHRIGDSRIGFGLGGAGSSFSLDGGMGSGSLASFNAGLFASQDFGNAYLTGVLGYGFHSTRTSRTVGADTLTGRFNAHTLSGRVEAGYRFLAGATTLVPYAAVEATSYRLPAYAESSALGGPFALAYGAQSTASARTELGARVSHAIGSITLTGRAAWAYNAAAARTVAAAFQSLPGTSFTVSGAAPARHALLLDAGVEAALTQAVSARLSFNGEFSSNVRSYGATAKLSYRW